MKTPAYFRRGLRLVLVALLLVSASCMAPHGKAPAPPAPLLLISLDAFRWDYCALHPEQTPRLRQLMREGVSARQLIPVFPSNTFPNHYTMVTGLYPSHHGIINNDFFDAKLGEFFHYTNPASAQKSQWWGGEPIWATAQRQGLKSACSFWVGSEAEIAGVRPTFWRPYDEKVPFETRLAELTAWLHLTAAERPAVITFYIEEANSIGHKYGPDSPELIATLKTLDDRIGAIVDHLRTENIPVNLVIVSDHGMTPISVERVVLLDDYVDRSAVQLDFDGPAAGLRPLNGDVPALLRAFAKLQHAKAYVASDLPARFQITDSPRNPPVWIVPDEGWEIYFQAHFEKFRAKPNRADHGYDNALSSMRGILIAQGPGFRSGGAVIEPVESVHLYNALCAAAGLRPAPNDGDQRLVRALLRR
jgi:predicted AlkP superfamily pyrophosphatase or phosphodiesterase